MMAGKDVAQERSRGTAGEEILRVEGDVSFSVRRGEILGWFGLVGAGRSEAAQALFGVDPFHGRVSIDRREVRIAHPRDAIRNGIGLVPEDRKLQGLVLKMAITPNVTLASLDRLSTAGVLTAAREQAVAAEYIDTLRIRCAGPGQPVEELSGGNQQKVVLARWLDTRPRVLILDEPTKGVDIAAKAEIHSIVRELARSGTAVILISSELDEIQQMADRILVFRAGRIRGEFTSASDAQLLSAATQ